MAHLFIYFYWPDFEKILITSQEIKHMYIKYTHKCTAKMLNNRKKAKIYCSHFYRLL